MFDTTNLLLGLVFGSIGVGYCIYGRKQKKPVSFWAGVGLIGLPYLVENNVWLALISIALLFAPIYIKR